MPHEIATPPPLPSALPPPPLISASPAPAAAEPAPPPSDTVLAPPIDAATVGWWPGVGRISRRLGYFLRTWRLEAQARLAGYSLSMCLHAGLFVALSLILMPARSRSFRAEDAQFVATIDTLIPGDTPGGDGPAGVSFALAGSPQASPESRPPGDPQRPSPFAGAETAHGAAEPAPSNTDQAVSTGTISAAPPAAGSDAAPPLAVHQAATGGPADPAAPTALASAASQLEKLDAERAAALARETASVGVNQPTSEPAIAVALASRGAAELAGPERLSAAHGGFGGRDPARRGEMLARYGGSATSENAVTLGLSWLAHHQLADGSWHFNHTTPACEHYCLNPGSFPSTTAATGLALLPFLGAGHTHTAGSYRETVRRGLFYLGERMIVTDSGGDLQEGSMYGQGIAAIALSEAYALTGDAELKPFAQAALDFIAHAQDPKGGGWRYMPLQPGDTTVTGWQVMALKSGLLAGLAVPKESLSLAATFLNNVEVDYGSGYGYLKKGKGPTTTAIGVLLRMFMGWPRERPQMVYGVERLARLGPSANDMYFNYNATQVMRHYGGEEWDRWNKQLRDQLIASQSQLGHAAGSWFREDEHGGVGGRLYMTCMSVMTLEVYYRHLPLYGERAGPE